MEHDPLLSAAATLNPYKRAGALIADRLRWDLNPQSHVSRRRLMHMRDAYHGKPAVILCNGPSLNKVDFEAIGGVYCFGLNKVNLLFERTDFRPNSVVCVNDFVVDQNLEFYNSTDLPLYLTSRAVKKVRPRYNVNYLHAANVEKFARDVSVSIYEGYTVTFVAMQIAFHLGFRDVALVGADHTFATKGPANQVVTSGAVDESHFDPRYFSGGVQWQLPDLFQSEVAYTMARDMYSAHGRKIVNATDGGQLEVFERESLQSFLGRTKPT